jgi:hypothetical protein
MPNLGSIGDYMHRITETIIRRISTAMVRRSWDIRDGAERLADRMEAVANQIAERWGVSDDVVAALNNEALSR